MEMIEKLVTRRSVKVKNLQAPGPNPEQLKQILTIATRVPDHGKLAPWRLVVMDKPAQAELGEVFAARFQAVHPDANDKQLAFERERPQRAPLMIAVLYCPMMGKIPAWEQQLSTGAVCMNLLHAANALGFGAQWLTEWPAFDPKVKEVLGGTLEDQIAGFIYLGTPTETPEDRVRPALEEVVRHGLSAR